jgi:hypothetical protein
VGWGAVAWELRVPVVVGVVDPRKAQLVVSGGTTPGSIDQGAGGCTWGFGGAARHNLTGVLDGDRDRPKLLGEARFGHGGGSVRVYVMRTDEKKKGCRWEVPRWVGSGK